MRKQNRMLIFSFLVISLALVQAAFAKELRLSKKELLSRLAQSPKWNLTEMPTADAEAKFQQAQAANRMHLGFFSREAIMRTNPISLGLGETGTLSTVGFGSTGVAAEYDILNLANQAQEEAADRNQRIGRANTKQYQNDLAFLCLLKYANVQQAHLKIDLARFSIHKDEEVLKLVSSKLKVGAGIPLDVARAEALLEKDKLKEIEAENQLRMAINDLEDLVGTLDKDIEVEPLAYSETQEKKIKEVGNSKNPTPDLEVAKESLLASQQLLKMSEAHNLPVVTVFGEVSTVGTQALGISNAPTGAVGIQLKLPLYDGGYRNGKIAEASGRVHYLENQESLLRDSHNRQLDLALFQLGAGDRAVRTSVKAVDLAKRELAFVEKKIHLGAGGTLDYINAEGNLVTAMDLNIQALWSFEVAKINFFHLTADLASYLSINELGSKNE